MRISPTSRVGYVSGDMPFKFLNICRHKNKVTGESTIVFQEKKATAVYPLKYKGICLKCLKEFSLTKEQYEYFKEKGEIPRDYETSKR